ncbi:MAG TPA: choice-of-anchor B family protein [Candidatus Deferrimicrobium sp.]|nr:choice-of-anchor B family protein [Candidatus Deferrimicrobium sp.]
MCYDTIYSFGAYGGTDCWGWRGPDGTEYAIMGVYGGVAFVNTATRQVITTVPGPQGGCGTIAWRTMGTYQHYCYAVSECYGTNEGVMVMDLQYLPDSVHFIGSFPISFLGDPTSHNLFVDTLKGYLYTEGDFSANYSIHILSLANPASPTYVSSFGPYNGVHDMFVMNDTAYVAEGYNPYFSVYDMSNKFAPILLKRFNIPGSGFVHNIWPTEDREYVATTEENANKTVKVWDVRDLNNIQLVGQYLAPSRLAHNARVKGDTIFISHYESGVAIVDISTPSAPVELGVYDTWINETPNFNGCWGVFPFTSNGLVYGSNMDGRLFVLTHQKAILADTMRIVSSAGAAGSQVRVDVEAVNSLPIRRFVIPINWSGPFNMTLASVSTAGLRTAYFEEQTFTGYDPANKRIAYSLTSSASGTSPDLPPGSGPILSLYFNIPAGATGGPNSVLITPYNDKQPTFDQKCLRYLPDTLSGTVSLGSLCCVGIRGNVDGDPADEINVADVVSLVSYLFQSGPFPPCGEEANVDGSAAGAVTVADLTYLVAYLFNGSVAPLSCL